MTDEEFDVAAAGPVQRAVESMASTLSTTGQSTIHEAKFNEGDTIVNSDGNIAVVKFAEPDDGGFIVVNWDNHKSTVWEFAYQDEWTKVEQYPVRWLVFGLDGRVVADRASLESALEYAAKFGHSRRILHIRKDGTIEWLDTEEEG